MKGPSGHIWNVEVVSEEKDGVFFDRGWKEFAKDHSLELGNFMVFEYIGDRRFSMLLFDSSACEKVEALSAKPSGCSKEVHIFHHQNYFIIIIYTQRMSQIYLKHHDALNFDALKVRHICIYIYIRFWHVYLI